MVLASELSWISWQGVCLCAHPVDGGEDAHAPHGLVDHHVQVLHAHQGLVGGGTVVSGVGRVDLVLLAAGQKRCRFD